MQQMLHHRYNGIKIKVGGVHLLGHTNSGCTHYRRINTDVIDYTVSSSLT